MPFFLQERVKKKKKKKKYIVNTTKEKNIYKLESHKKGFNKSTILFASFFFLVRSGSPMRELRGI